MITSMTHRGTKTYLQGIPDLSIRQLECFVAVGEELQFVRAARRLGMAQPPVSRLIQRLENTIGIRLFDRTSRGVSLTVAGEAMLGPARRVLNEVRRVSDAGARAAAGESGSLHIGFSSSAAFSALPEVVRRYRIAWPRVQLTLRELTTAEQIADLEAGLLDVAIARGPIHRAGIVSTRLLREPFVAAVPSDHPLGAQQQVSLRSLAGERFVFIPRHVAPDFYDEIIRHCHRAHGAFRIAEEAAEWHTIVGLVGAGLGVSITPASLQRLAWTTVAFRPLADTRLTADLVVARRDEDPPPLVREFISTALDRLSIPELPRPLDRRESAGKKPPVRR
jgi:DNA-binding transcriptional LysR family regulator